MATKVRIFSHAKKGQTSAAPLGMAVTTDQDQPCRDDETPTTVQQQPMLDNFSAFVRSIPVPVPHLQQQVLSSHLPALDNNCSNSRCSAGNSQSTGFITEEVSALTGDASMLLHNLLNQLMKEPSDEHPSDSQTCLATTLQNFSLPSEAAVGSDVDETCSLHKKTLSDIGLTDLPTNGAWYQEPASLDQELITTSCTDGCTLTGTRDLPAEAAEQFAMAGETRVNKGKPWDKEFTTVIMYGIPCWVTRRTLRLAIKKRGFDNRVDSLLMLLDNYNLNVNCALINFVKPKYAQAFRKVFDGIYVDKHVKLSQRALSVHPAGGQDGELRWLGRRPQSGHDTFTWTASTPLNMGSPGCLQTDLPSTQARVVSIQRAVCQADGLARPAHADGVFCWQSQVEATNEAGLADTQYQ